MQSARRSTVGLAFVVAAALGLSDVPVWAASIGDAGNGHALAKRLCSNCHIVDGEGAAATISADVPSFAAIADLPDQSAERIAGRIVVPHPPMPQIELTRNEIRDLTAYILSLKGQ